MPVSSSGNPQQLQQCLTHSRCLVSSNPLAGGRAGAVVWILGLSAQDGKGNEMGRNKPLVGAGAPAWAGGLGGGHRCLIFPSMTLRAGPEPQGPPGPVSRDGCGPGQESRGTVPPPARTPTPIQTGKAFVLRTYPPPPPRGLLRPRLEHQVHLCAAPPRPGFRPLGARGSRGAEGAVLSGAVRSVCNTRDTPRLGGNRGLTVTRSA